MKADALSLAATLNNSEVDYYTIPQYQRPYTWTDEEYDTLMKDLLEAYDGYKKNQETSSIFDSYFLGPVVFVHNNNTMDIIDGQQRTTTIHILLWYLVTVLTDTDEKDRIKRILLFLDREPKLRVSNRDSATFKLICSGATDFIGATPMIKAAKYFGDIVHKIDNPNLFSKFLREKTQFIVIVAEDYAKAWDLFIGINSKGVPLNPTDLVKAFVCGNSTIGERIGDIWEQKIHPLNENSTQFLLFLTRHRAKKFVSENYLFREFSKLFPASISINDLSQYSDIFRIFWLVPETDIPSELGMTSKLSEICIKNLRLIRNLGRKDITSIVFILAEIYGPEVLFNKEFLDMIAVFQIRLASVNKRSRERKIITFFSATAFEQMDINQALAVLCDFIKAEVPNDSEFKNAILGMYYNNATMRRILQSYEEGKRGNSYFVDTFDLEHLMPQTGTDYWYDKAGTTDKIEYQQIINNIGNLFVLDHLTNNDVKNHTFDDKKTNYLENASGWSIAQIVKDKTDWTPVDIQNRANVIADWAVSRWSV